MVINTKIQRIDWAGTAGMFGCAGPFFQKERKRDLRNRETDPVNGDCLFFHLERWGVEAVVVKRRYTRECASLFLSKNIKIIYI